MQGDLFSAHPALTDQAYRNREVARARRAGAPFQNDDLRCPSCTDALWETHPPLYGVECRSCGFRGYRDA